MILSGTEIKAQLGKGIHISPFNPEQLNPNSYNVRLHKDLLVYNEAELDMRKENQATPLEIPPQGLVLQPHKLYLARTVEHFESPGFVPMIEGRSSVARLGLNVHVSAGLGHIGAQGFWTLELFCVQPLRVYANVEIAQVYWLPLQGQSTQQAYNGKYHKNKGVQPSMLYKEFV